MARRPDTGSRAPPSPSGPCQWLAWRAGPRSGRSPPAPTRPAPAPRPARTRGGLRGGGGARASSTPVSTSSIARTGDTQARRAMTESSQQGAADKLRTFRLPAFAEHVGIEVIETRPDRVVGRIVVGPQHSNGRDRVHGGAIMSLADTLGAIGTVLNLPEGAATTTIESKTNFLAAGRGPQLIGEATPRRPGVTAPSAPPAAPARLPSNVGDEHTACAAPRGGCRREGGP